MLKLKREAEEELGRDIQACGVHAFPLVMTAPTLQTGIQSVIQAYGVGPLKANTILLNWLGQTPGTLLGLDGQDFGMNLRGARFFGCNIVILDAKEDKWDALDQIAEEDMMIDVWWTNDATSRLMLLFSYIIIRHEKWSKARIRLLAPANLGNQDETVESLEEMLADVRIDARPYIIEDVDADRIAETSGDASLVFLPFRIRRNQVVDLFGNPMGETLFFLPVCAMVLAARDIDLDAEPEAGEAGEKAAMLDALEAAQKRARETAREAEEAAQALEKAEARAEQDAREADKKDAGESARLEKDEETARELAVKTSRRAAKAAAKAEIAVREAEAMGVVSPEKGSKEG
jgi:hypothetical protein